MAESDFYKYMKYKSKYKNHNSKMSCNPSHKFKKICYDDKSGQYSNKKICMDKCVDEYIQHNLNVANLAYETKQFKYFIKNILTHAQNDAKFDSGLFDVYIKGGTVIGLMVLKLMYDKANHSKNGFDTNMFTNLFKSFLELNLIRDWDFAAYVRNDIKFDKKYTKQMDQIARKYGLVPFAKTVILYQLRQPIKIDDSVLFEIALLDNNDYSNLELPLTTMKMEITSKNIKYVFMLAKSFYCYKIKDEPIDIDMVIYMLKYVNVKVDPCKNGLFIVSVQVFDTAGFSEDLLKFIKNFANRYKRTDDEQQNLEQFLICQIQEPNRIFHRLVNKNIPKTIKISEFLTANKLVDTRPDWLIDPTYIMNLIDKFIKEFGEVLSKIYLDNISEIAEIPMTMPADRTILDKNLAAIENAIVKISEFMTGVNIDRIKIHYEDFGTIARLLIRTMFEPLYKQIHRYLNYLSDEIKLLCVMKFLQKKNIFVDDF